MHTIITLINKIKKGFPQVKMIKLSNMFLAVLFLFLTGCSTVNYIVPPSTDLEINVAKDVNPDINGRPSPVVIRVFELSSRAVFDTQDFFSLYGNAEKALGPDLLKKDEIELQPGQKLDYKMKLNQNTRFIGIIVAYRDIDKAKWRAVIKADPTGYDDVRVNVESIATYLKEE